MKHTYAKDWRVQPGGALLLLPLLLGYAQGCSDESPKDGYYLRGRVFNGASSEPVGGAELSLLAGQGTRHVTAAADGTYLIGPIDPSASYRLEAKADGMAEFEFTGLALPALNPGLTRTLIGDVALFEGSKKAPAFVVRVQSDDERIPARFARVDFLPTAVGADPAVTGIAAAPVPQTGTVIGAFAQPGGATLPNQMDHGAQSYHASASDGVAMIPEEALKWGATYRVKIDAGPDFEPVTFMLTAVRDDDIEVVLERANPVSMQLPQDSQQYFTGRIYDGVTLARLTSYKMQLEYFDRTLEGKVDSTGRYVIGPLLSNADYTISVEVDGYRNFLSHNVKLPITGRVTAFYYDAFVYPADIKAPAVKVRFSMAGNTSLPSGTVRFAPRGSSALFNDDAETPAGVNRQVWTNDEDLQQRALVRDFKDGVLDIAEGELVLGVEYAVSVFGVAGYAVLSNGDFRAGVDANPSFTLESVNEVPLSVVAMSSQNAALSEDGHLEVRFNHDVALYPRMDQAVALRALNDAFAIVSPDRDNDTELNTLIDPGTLPDPITPSYRGVTFEVKGDRLTLKWNREIGLATKDAMDPIDGVTYGGLSALWLYTGTLPNSPASTLADLIDSAAVQVQMKAR